MSLNAYELSAGVFVRGLANLKAQLVKAEAQVAASGRDAATLLHARLARPADVASDANYDLHTYTLAAQVHWAAQGARVAIARILGAAATPSASDAESFSDLYQRIDATIADLEDVAETDIEAGLDQEIVVEHRRGAVAVNGGRFLLAYAIPHFFYHVTSAYAILRTEGVQLTMGDFLGNWATD